MAWAATVKRKGKDRRDRVVTLRVTEAEHKRIVARATEQGQHLSDFLRTRLGLAGPDGFHDGDQLAG